MIVSFVLMGLFHLFKWWCWWKRSKIENISSILWCHKFQITTIRHRSNWSWCFVWKVLNFKEEKRRRRKSDFFLYVIDNTDMIVNAIFDWNRLVCWRNSLWKVCKTDFDSSSLSLVRSLVRLALLVGPLFAWMIRTKSTVSYLALQL